MNKEFYIYLIFDKVFYSNLQVTIIIILLMHSYKSKLALTGQWYNF